MAIVNPLDLDTLTLEKGAHKPNDGFCVMEAVAYIAGEPWTDHPACASPVIAAFMRSWNDSLNDDDRNRLLKPYVTKLVGTAATPEIEDARAWMTLDWLVRTCTPAWLRCAGLNDQAARLAELPEFKAGMDVPSIRPAIDAVREDARAACDAARAAAWAAAGAAGAAAWAAAGDAACDAARAAAWAAAGAAAWAAARDAAGAGAGAAAWDAARDAARAAAGAAAGARAACDAAWAAGDAARAAAWDAARAGAWAAARAAAGAAAWAPLQPVVDELQPLALELIDRMIASPGPP
jgi:hypothetical protein